MIETKHIATDGSLAKQAQVRRESPIDFVRGALERHSKAVRNGVSSGSMPTEVLQAFRERVVASSDQVQILTKGTQDCLSELLTTLELSSLGNEGVIKLRVLQHLLASEKQHPLAEKFVKACNVLLENRETACLGGLLLVDTLYHSYKTNDRPEAISKVVEALQARLNERAFGNWRALACESLFWTCESPGEALTVYLDAVKVQRGAFGDCKSQEAWERATEIVRLFIPTAEYTDGGAQVSADLPLALWDAFTTEDQRRLLKSIERERELIPWAQSRMMAIQDEVDTVARECSDLVIKTMLDSSASQNEFEDRQHQIAGAHERAIRVFTELCTFLSEALEDLKEKPRDRHKAEKQLVPQIAGILDRFCACMSVSDKPSLGCSPTFADAVGRLVMEVLEADLDEGVARAQGHFASEAFYSPSDEVRVLITNRSTNLRESIARLIHENSPRSNGSFISFDCSAVGQDRLAVELFGRKESPTPRGSEGASQEIAPILGVFERARGGTLFLDRIEELPIALQERLLNSLKNQQVMPVGGKEAIAIDVRLISGTQRDLYTDVDSGHFSDDLLDVLEDISIHPPPAKKSCNDICKSIRGFSVDTKDRYSLPPSRFSPEALKMLLEYPWQNDATSLQKGVSLALLCAGNSKQVELHHLPRPISKRSEERARARPGACKSIYTRVLIPTFISMLARGDLESALAVRMLFPQGVSREVTRRVMIDDILGLNKDVLGEGFKKAAKQLTVQPLTPARQEELTRFRAALISLASQSTVDESAMDIPQAVYKVIKDLLAKTQLVEGDYLWRIKAVSMLLMPLSKIGGVVEKIGRKVLAKSEGGWERVLTAFIHAYNSSDAGGSSALLRRDFSARQIDVLYRLCKGSSAQSPEVLKPSLQSAGTMEEFFNEAKRRWLGPQADMPASHMSGRTWRNLEVLSAVSPEGITGRGRVGDEREAARRVVVTAYVGDKRQNGERMDSRDSLAVVALYTQAVLGGLRSLDSGSFDLVKFRESFAELLAVVLWGSDGLAPLQSKAVYRLLSQMLLSNRGGELCGNQVFREALASELAKRGATGSTNGANKLLDSKNLKAVTRAWSSDLGNAKMSAPRLVEENCKIADDLLCNLDSETFGLKAFQQSFADMLQLVLWYSEELDRAVAEKALSTLCRMLTSKRADVLCSDREVRQALERDLVPANLGKLVSLESVVKLSKSREK